MKPHYPVHPLAFHFSFPLHFKAKVKKKRFRGRKIIDDYTYMIYSMDLHTLYSRVFDQGLEFLWVGFSIARLDVLCCAMKHAPADSLFNELREIALFHTLRTQKGTQRQVGFL